jgi:hypothetical protein
MKEDIKALIKFTVLVPERRTLKPPFVQTPLFRNEIS